MRIIIIYAGEEDEFWMECGDGSAWSVEWGKGEQGERSNGQTRVQAPREGVNREGLNAGSDITVV